MIFNEFLRFYVIVRIILRYGLSDFIPKNKLIFLLKLKNRFLLRIFNRYSQLKLAERLRLALQELGPIWIKFGQMLSTRRDIFSKNITDQLDLLQDRVEPCDSVLARLQIEQSIGVSLETWFDDFQDIPLASASIAQVHAAKLKINGKDIVIKVIRPGIISVIKKDIKLMHRLAYWAYRFLPAGQKIKFSDIVLEYEKTIFNELNLLKETANTLQLRRNFKLSNILYIPKVYIDFCRENVIVMERIYATPVYNIEQLKNSGTNMKLLAERGVEIFFTQVFRDGFFHGDMHPGNIFINHVYPDNPQYISIDCGIMGSVNRKDKYYLAANFIAFFNRDYRKIAELHLASGWIPINTNILDFECAMRTVFEPIFEQPIEEISFSNILLYLFNTARFFNMEIQPQLLLLQKTLLYTEGILRQLYPRLNLWQSAKPFLEKWMKEQIQISKVICTLRDRMPYWIDKIFDLPLLLYDDYQYSKKLQTKIEILTEKLENSRNSVRSLFLIGVLCIFSSILIFLSDKTIKIIFIYLFMIGIVIWIIGWKRIE